MNRRFVFWLCLSWAWHWCRSARPRRCITRRARAGITSLTAKRPTGSAPAPRTSWTWRNRLSPTADYNITLHAAHRVLRVWPLSDYAPRAEYLIGRCLEATGKDEAAFNAYESHHPKISAQPRITRRCCGGNTKLPTVFSDGEWFRLWGNIPLYPSMDQTAKMFGKIVTNGPYSDVAPHAQLRIGAARENQKDYAEAVKAYETAADRYHDQPVIAADALYREGIAYQKQAATAEYDQGTAGQAIAAYTDFITLFPDDKRVPAAQRAIIKLKDAAGGGQF